MDHVFVKKTKLYLKNEDSNNTGGKKSITVWNNKRNINNIYINIINGFKIVHAKKSYHS